MILNTVRPMLPWQPLDEIIDGVLVHGADQFEAGDGAKQLTLGQIAGRPALRIEVDGASQYRSSSWLRGIGRLTSPSDQRFVEGSRVAVAKQLLIPAGQILDGATVIDEAHGPGNIVAPVRLLVRPDGNLYASFNGGTFVNGGFTGWTKEQPVGPFTFGIEHELAYEIVFHRDPAKGRLTVYLDGRLVFDKAGATGQVVNGAWQHPYLLTGIYVGSASVPVVCLLGGVVVADSMLEASAGLRALLDEAQASPPAGEHAPAYVTRAELDQELAALKASLLSANASRDELLARHTTLLGLVKQAADKTPTAAFSKALRALWPAA